MLSVDKTSAAPRQAGQLLPHCCRDCQSWTVICGREQRASSDPIWRHHQDGLTDCCSASVCPCVNRQRLSELRPCPAQGATFCALICQLNSVVQSDCRSSTWYCFDRRLSGITREFGSISEVERRLLAADSVSHQSSLVFSACPCPAPYFPLCFRSIVATIARND